MLIEGLGIFLGIVWLLTIIMVPLFIIYLFVSMIKDRYKKGKGKNKK